MLRQYCIFLGRFCFCGDELPPTQVADTDCTDKCSGDATQNCGSKDHVSVFTAAPPILGLTLTSSAGSNVLELHNAVTFTVSLSSGGAQLAFKMDYDDGAGKTDQNATGLWNREYHVPGHYKVSVYGNDQMESLMVRKLVTTNLIHVYLSVCYKGQMNDHFFLLIKSDFIHTLQKLSLY